MGSQRGEVPWRKVPQLLVINRLCDPGSEFAVHRGWFLRGAMDELLATDCRNTLLKKMAVLQRDADRVASLVKIREPKVSEPVNRETFVCTFDRSALRKVLDRDGCYILRAYSPPEDTLEVFVWEKQAPVPSGWYTQLVHVEEAFRTLKSDMDLRPIHHQIESRVEAHIFVALPA